MPDPASLGRTLLLIGLGLAVLGGALWGLSRVGLPIGHLPGDFRFQVGGVSCFIPLATSVLLSLGLTLLLNLLLRLLNK
ncbi:MAG TPA: DUF2905 domain-containing protein [Anaerolineales bacterium]|nr:DUF2905 domain-containing protein [Anaerolineales bacterium]